MLLVDEINRASPKTQSALLEAMQEAQVTIDGATYALEQPFLVVATQNPIEYEGTYPLPEAQLDRFTRAARRSATRRSARRRGCSPSRRRRRRSTRSRRSPTATTSSARSRPRARVYVEESVGEYVVSILRHTRESSLLALGASPRAGIALLRMAKARAVAQGRDYVVPEDVQAVASPFSRTGSSSRRRRAPPGFAARTPSERASRRRRLRHEQRERPDAVGWGSGPSRSPPRFASGSRPLGVAGVGFLLAGGVTWLWTWLAERPVAVALDASIRTLADRGRPRARIERPRSSAARAS